MSNQTTEQVDQPTTHLRVLVNALQIAVRRGALELEEAGNVQDSIKYFTLENQEKIKDQDPEQNNKDYTEHMQKIIGMCEVAQKRGAFNLVEAHSLYPHVKFFIKEEEQTETPPVSENNDTCSREICNNEECTPDNCPCDEANTETTSDNKCCTPGECPCPPENCPCDENNCCLNDTQTESNIKQTIEKVVPSQQKEENWNKFD